MKKKLKSYILSQNSIFLPNNTPGADIQGGALREEGLVRVEEWKRGQREEGGIQAG